MSTSVQTASEQERLAALYELGILDTEPESAFDEITQLAASLCETPMAFVVMVDEARLWIKSQFGTQPPLVNASRQNAFCDYTVRTRELTIIPDALQDSRFIHNPLVTSNLAIRFYAGAPLIIQTGVSLGTLCVLDQKPRTLTPTQAHQLQMLARQVVAQLELRKNLRQLQSVNATLENNLAYQKAILESISDGVIAVKTDGEFIACNKHIEKILGLSAATLAQNKNAYQDFIGAEFLAQRKEFIRQKYHLSPDIEVKAFATEVKIEEISATEMLLTRADGTTIPVEVTVSPIRKNEDETIGFLSITKDISERKNNELQIQQQLIEISDLYHHAPCGYCSLDTNGVFTRINDTLLNWLGYKREEIIGKMRGDDLYPKKETRLLSARLAQIKRQGFLDTEIELKRRDGSIIPLLLNATAEYDEKGKFIQTRAILIDITERQIVEKLKEKLYTSLEKANSQLEDQVQKRTLELRETISSLVTQIQERERAEMMMRQLSHRLVTVQEEERHHLARELHDEIGQFLTALKLQLEMILHTLPEAKSSLFLEAQKLVNELIGKTRQLSLNLRPPLLDDLGLALALEAHTRRFQASSGIEVHFLHNGIQGERFSPQIELAAYRIIQEALTNIARYAKVSKADVKIWRGNNTLNIEIADEGNGFDYQAALNAGNTSGLLSMRERANLLGGEFLIHTTPHDGTLISVVLPLS